LSPDVLPHIPKLIEIYLDSVETNLSPSQITQLICLAPKITRQKLVFTNLPTEIFKSGRAYNPRYKQYVFVWDTDFETIRQLLDLFQNGFWPTVP